MPSSIEETIKQLADEPQPLLNAVLGELSDLNHEEVEILAKVWPTISPERRLKIVSRLVELAEDDFELNFDDIFKYCLKDSDASVRHMAVDGLWENEQPSLIHPLIELMEQDASQEVQAAAAAALGKFALLAEEKKLRECHETRIFQALMGVINDVARPVEVRRRALESVGPINLPQVEQAIREAYGSNNHLLKISAVYAMGRNANPVWLPILLAEMESADADMRYEAALAAGELGEEDAVDNLIKLADDADTEVQMASIQALGQIGGPGAKDFLETMLDSPSEAIQQAAEEALYLIEIGEEPSPFRH